MKKTIFFLLALFIFGLGLFLYFNRSAPNPALQEPDSYLVGKAERLKKENKTDDQKHVFCGNSFFPAVPGANWTYLLTYRDQTDLVGVNVPEPEDGRLIIDIKLASNSWTFRHELSCEDGKIKLSNLNLLNLLGKINTYTTPEQNQGFILPGNMEGMTSWYLKMTTKNEVIDPATESITQTYFEEISMNFGKSDPRKITSIIGDLEAENITASGTIEKRAVSAGGESEEKGLKTFNWNLFLADQIGIVRSEYQEEGDSVIILELRGLQIPAKSL